MDMNVDEKKPPQVGESEIPGNDGAAQATPNEKKPKTPIQPLVDDVSLPIQDSPVSMKEMGLVVLDATSFDDKQLPQLDLATILSLAPDHDKRTLPELVVLTQPNCEVQAMDIAEMVGYYGGTTRYILSRVQHNGSCKYRNCGGVISNDVQARVMIKPNDDGNRSARSDFVKRTPHQRVTGASLQPLLEQLVFDTPATSRMLITGQKDRETKKLGGFHRLKVAIGEGSGGEVGTPSLTGSLFAPRLAAPSSYSPQKRMCALINVRPRDVLVAMKSSMQRFCALSEEQQKALFTPGTDFEDQGLEDLKNCEWFQCLPTDLTPWGGSLSSFLEKDVIKQLTVAISKRRKSEMAKKKKKGEKRKAPSTPRKAAGITAAQQISTDFCAFLEAHMGDQLKTREIVVETLRATGLARAVGVSLVNEYINVKKLAEGRKITPDAPLAGLLFNENMTQGEKDGLNHFNLQRFMNKHYISKPKKARTSADTVASATVDS